MKDLHYSIQISKPRAEVWDTMLQDATYRKWTAEFMPGSYYQGDWSEGSKMLFLGPGATSEGGEGEGGMAAMVKENRHHEFISLQHYAEIRNGVEKTWPDAGFENYTFSDVDGGTQIDVDMLNTPDEYADMFNETWPNALAKLKEVAEA